MLNDATIHATLRRHACLSPYRRRPSKRFAPRLIFATLAANRCCFDKASRRTASMF